MLRFTKHEREEATTISNEQKDPSLGLNENSGFLRHNGIRVISAEAEHSVLKADITAGSRNIWGNVHGGLIYTMADTAAGAMARAAGKKNSTLNASISYLRPAADVDELYAYGSATKAGRSTGVYQVSIRTADGVELAVAQVTMFFLE